MADFDPFDSPWEEEPKADEQSVARDDNPTPTAQTTDDNGELIAKRKVGRPRVRPIQEKGPVGRPRIRPIEVESRRGPGRPRRDSSGMADRIRKEAIVSGGISGKTTQATMKTMETTVRAFNVGVVTPLNKSITRFAQNIDKFNQYHQEYLKDQITLARNVQESFDRFRKVGIDPVLRTMARTARTTGSIDEVMQVLKQDKKYANDESFKRTADSVAELNKNVQRYTLTGVAGVEATNKFIKEYYKTSKGTSRFLNAVTYTIDDVAEDIASLRADLDKYLTKNKKPIIVDQSETLKKIEKNTKQPSLGKRILSHAITAAVAGVKTAFKYNRAGVTDFAINLLNEKVLGKEGKESKEGGIYKVLDKLNEFLSPKNENFNEAPKTLAGQFAKLWRDTVDIEIGRLIRDQEGQLGLRVRQNYVFGNESAARGAARASRKAKQATQSIVEKIDSTPIVQAIKTQTKELLQGIQNIPVMARERVAEFKESDVGKNITYTRDVAATMIVNALQEMEARTNAHLQTVITNYGKKLYDGPYGGRDGRVRLEDKLYKTLDDWRKEQKQRDLVFNEGRPETRQWNKWFEKPANKKKKSNEEGYASDSVVLDRPAASPGETTIKIDPADFKLDKPTKPKKSIKQKISQTTENVYNTVNNYTQPAIEKVQSTIAPVAEKAKEVTRPLFTKIANTASNVKQAVADRVSRKDESRAERTERSTDFKEKFFGKIGSVSLDPDSESSISTVNMSSPVKALAGIARINARIMGYMKKTWDKTKKPVKEKPGGDKKGSLWDLGKLILGGLGVKALLSKRNLFKAGGALAKYKGLAFGIPRLMAGFKGIAGKGAAKFRQAGATGRVLWDTFGWGSARVNLKEAAKHSKKIKDAKNALEAAKASGNAAQIAKATKDLKAAEEANRLRSSGTRALGIFKQSKLGQSKFGTALRQMRLASAGKGTSLGSRAMGFLANYIKWGQGWTGLAGGTAAALRHSKAAQLGGAAAQTLKAGERMKNIAAKAKFWENYRTMRAMKKGSVAGKAAYAAGKYINRPLAKAAKFATGTVGKTAAIAGTAIKGVGEGIKTAISLPGKFIKGIKEGSAASKPLLHSEAVAKRAKALKAAAKPKTLIGRIGKTISIIAGDAKAAVASKFAKSKAAKTATQQLKHAKDLAKLGAVGKGIAKAEQIGSAAAKGAGTVAKSAGTLVGKGIGKVKGIASLVGKSAIMAGGAAFGHGGIAKAASKSIGKQLGKAAGKGIAKTLLKQVPILGALLGIGFGIHRMMHGEILDGILEIVSGFLTIIPSGAGNAAALGIDAYLAGKDIHKAIKKSDKGKKATEKVKQESAKEAKGVINQLWNWGKDKEKAKAETPEVKPAQVVQPKQNNSWFNWNPKPVAKPAAKPTDNSLKARQEAAKQQIRNDRNKVLQGDGSVANFIASAQKAQDGMFAKGGTLQKAGEKEGTIKHPILVDIWGKVKKVAGAAFNAQTAVAKKAVNVAKDVKQTYFDTEKVDTSKTWSKDSNTKAIEWGPEAVHDSMAQPFMNKFGAAAEQFYKDKGRPVRVTSARRTNTKQAQLWVRGKILREPGIFTPAAPAYTETVNVRGKYYKVQGTGQTMRSGHMGGAAVDVANWKEFLPYARGAGLHWMGQSDPVHFQIDQKFPVPKPASQIAQAPKGQSAKPSTKDGQSHKVAAAPAASTTTAIKQGDPVGTGVYQSAAPRPAKGQGAQPISGPQEPQISPMVQDYGLSIINNLLFSS